MPDIPPSPDQAGEDHVIILAPHGRDATIAASLLAEDGLNSQICPDLPSLVAALDTDAGAILVTQEALTGPDLHSLTAWLAAQPAWSDLPFVVLTQRGGGPERNPVAQSLVNALGNVTLLERPFHPVTLISVIRTTLRSRRRQYQARAQLQELARRQREIEESHERFQALADNIPVLSWTADADGAVFWFNSRWYDYTGTDFAQMRDWGWQSVHDPKSLAEVLVGWRASIASGANFEMVVGLRGADGIFRPFLTQVAPLRDEAGQVFRWVGTHTDISSQRRTEAALAESQARLQAILDTVPVGIIFAEMPTGRLVFGNAAVEQIFRHPMRYSQDVADYREWEAYDEAGRRIDGPEFPLAQALATGGPSSGDFHFVCGDGVQRWLGISSAPIRDHDGQITGAVVVCTDIDELRRAQNVLARDKRALETLVSDRTRELEATQTQLAHAQRMEALGQLAGGIAHDFNNVIQAVQGGARLIERNPADAARVRSLAGMITEAASRGAAVTRRLLAFSRRGDLRAEPIDAGTLLHGMREILSHTLGAGIRVQVDIADCCPLGLLADKGQLETVLVNLATNARDAMKEAGQSSGILTLAAAADVGLAGTGVSLALTPGSYVRLSVSDTGAGMAPDVLAKASEPFFTTKKMGEGTGLGLAMARGFAEQSGGGLLIESELGRGTQVHLWLPVAAAPAASAVNVASHDAPATTAARDGRGARLLLVDDERIVRDTLAQQMTQEGFTVQPASGGAEAVARLDAGERFDLVIADLSMPGMDGVTLIRELQGRQPGLPAILLTGFATDTAEIAISGEMQGRFTLLRKPVDGSVLADRAAVLLETSMPISQASSD